MMIKVRIGAATGLVLGLSCLVVGCQDPSPDKASLKYSAFCRFGKKDLKPGHFRNLEYWNSCASRRKNGIL